MSADLHTLFNPHSIAIVGVSHEPKKVGYLVAKNIIDQGFEGELYFVNPHAEKILGKKVYESLTAIAEPIDLAILSVPNVISMKLLEEVHTLGIKHVVIYAAGFKETDEPGKVLEAQLIQKAKDYDLTVLGPNCLGFINTAKKINATFLKHSSPVGNISVISQSGALGSVMIDYFVDHLHQGISYFISLGNKTVIDESDCLEFLAQDTHTDVIGMYLEDVKDGNRFRETLRKVTKIKPVVILKSGTSQEGSKAALSHTGGLVGDAQVYDAVFKQAGAVHAETYEQFLQILKIYSFNRVPSSSEILVLSNAGGVGVLLTDQLVKHNLSMVTISEHLIKKIQDATSHAGTRRITIHNPIDLLGDASAFDYREAILASIQQRNIGAVIVLLTPQANTEIQETAKTLVEAQNHFVKPIYPVFMGGQSIIDAHRLFEQHKLVSFESYEIIPQVVEKIVASYNYLDKTASRYSPESLTVLAHEAQIKDMIELAGRKKFMNLEESMKVLKLSGVPTLPLYLAQHEEELIYLTKKIRYPVAAKIASDSITHKTEVKGVITDIETDEDLRKAFKKLSRVSKSEGCYIQKMVDGQEIFVGIKRDSTFGPVVVYGIGGIFVELVKEFSQFVYPFSLTEFSLAIKNTRLNSLIKGFRGSPAINLKDLYSLGMTLGFLLSRFDEIKAIDINPLFSTEKGLLAADCRIILA
ncbi:MAG: acetate--CoA ligase family protein [Patescibacteria group bacterium]